MAENLHTRLGELFSVALAVLSAPALDDALAELVRALTTELHFRAAIVRLHDFESDKLRLVAAYGLSESYLDKGSIVASQSGLDARVLAGESVELEDVTTDPAFQYPERARQEGIRSVLAVPISVHGEPRGVLRAYTGEPHAFTAEERGVLEAVARLSGEAFEKARRAAALESIERDLGSTLDPDEVIDRLLSHTIGALRFSGAVLRLLDEDGVLLLERAKGLSRRYLKAGERRADNGFDARVLAGETVVIRDLAHEGGLAYVDAALAEGIRSVVSVPLSSRGRAIGLLRAYSRRVRSYGPSELRFVRFVADIGALALENARLHRILKERVAELGAEASGWFHFLTLS